MAQAEFQKYVADILEVAMFENWLRFYFIEENPDDETLKLQIPVKSMERIGELYPALQPLAEKMNGNPIDFQISRDNVLSHIMNEMEGKVLPQGEAQRVLQSATFQTRLQLFHTWEQLHEDQLDSSFMEFGAWRNLFAQWRETAGARELEQKLLGH